MFSAATKTGSQPSASANYIEDVFSTYLYTGNGSTQTINNGIDLSGKGGMTWIKARTVAYNNVLFDTERGVLNSLRSNQTAAQSTDANSLTAFNSNGFSLGSAALENINTGLLASWTFRKQPKFFDVQTATKSGGIVTFNHSLGVAPGMVFVKCTNTAEDWLVYHRSLGTSQYLLLNTTDAAGSYSGLFSSSSTQFSLNSADGTNYVAYLFAHDAGGFGTTGTDNVISCGSFTADGTGSATINLGYEPQYILWKQTTGTAPWYIYDVMRGFSYTTAQSLFPNSSAAESADGDPTGGVYFTPTATGFSIKNFINASVPYIYMAIRRPMKVPTSGTQVFLPTNNPANGDVITTGFPVDMTIWNYTSSYSANSVVNDRLRGTSSNDTTNGPSLYTASTAAENGLDAQPAWFWTNTSYKAVTDGAVFYAFRRASGFFDEVCYTGGGIKNHNLGVIPELAIVKRRDSTGNWEAAVPAPTPGYFYVGASGSSPMALNLTNSGGGSSYLWSDYASATTFDASGLWWNGGISGATYVAYLFATVAGVSKVGSYTGTGSTQTINCGFTGGARFVLIKRTDSTGDWWFWDTARGMVSGTDYRSRFNTTAAQTNANWVYTATTGFQIVTSDASVNASGGSYIFLAIA